MLERLAQLIANKLEPKIERIVQYHLDELRLEVIDGVANAASVIAVSVDARIASDIDAAKIELEKQIKQDILRGVKF